MNPYRHLELLSRGPVTRVRLLDHRPCNPENVAGVISEWNSLADRADCQALVVDCSNVHLISSELLSKLILLERRLKERRARLLLSGLRAEAREVLAWTKLDRFFEIYEDEQKQAAVCA